MSREAIHVIIMVKYIRGSHEMIQVKHRHLLTTLIKKIHKNKHSHEMT